MFLAPIVESKEKVDVTVVENVDFFKMILNRSTGLVRSWISGVLWVQVE